MRRYFSCLRKKVHTRRSALETIEDIVSRGGTRGHIYQCEFGRHWHISSSAPLDGEKYQARAAQRAKRGLATPGGPTDILQRGNWDT